MNIVISSKSHNLDFEPHTALIISLWFLFFLTMFHQGSGFQFVINLINNPIYPNIKKIDTITLFPNFIFFAMSAVLPHYFLLIIVFSISAEKAYGELMAVIPDNGLYCLLRCCQCPFLEYSKTYFIIWEY